MAAGHRNTTGWDVLTAPTSSSSAPRDAATMAQRVLDGLDRAQIRYCLLRAYDHLPESASSDIDFVVPASQLPLGLARMFQRDRARTGCSLVQCTRHESAYMYVLAGTDASGSRTLLRLDAWPDVELSSRLFYTGDEILEGRRLEQRLWVPAAQLDFGCSLVRKIARGSLTDGDAARLSELYRREPEACEREIVRFWKPVSAGILASAARSGRWDEARADLHRLRSELLREIAARHPLRTIGRWISDMVLRAQRWLRPQSGLHVVLLGPDGAGKSTVMDALRREVGPAFSDTVFGSFAPGLLPGRFQRPHEGDPHGLPPRSVAASLLKAGFWLVYYTIGYFVTAHPSLARSRLILSHRYLLDALVDPKRYRYAGPLWILRLIWRVARKPHLIILLDAPAEVIQLRKAEVPLEETARQREAYRTLVARQANGHIADAAQPIERTAADVTDIVLQFMAARTARRLQLER